MQQEHAVRFIDDFPQMTSRRLDFVQGAAETYSRFADNR